MQVKTYKAPTMDKALAMVKKELGPDAIILSSRRAPAGSLEAGFEVTAALDQQAAVPQSEHAPGNDSLSAEVKSDIQEIKSFLSLLISSRDNFAQHQMKQPVAEIYHSLLVRGLDEKQAYLLLNRAVADLNGGSADPRQIFDAFCKRVLGKIGLAKPFRSLSSAGSVFTFVGPTGVGKTTTLAKLAAYLKIKRQLEVGIISLDTYRIGAVEQLQTYANILEVPFSVAQNKAEFVGTLHDLRHCDVVLVDTTGKNYLQREHVHRLQSLFDDAHNKFNHFLVLSATAKDEDLKQTILHFREMNISSLIFTKLDETVHHGCMLNQLLRFDYPLAYMGTGQRVPEDIEPATQKRLLSFLLPVRNRTA